MDHWKSVLRIHGNQLEYAPLGNASTFASLSMEKALLADYTTVELASLLVPSVLLLVLCPFRLFQLRGAGLKVLPNKTGAFKAVSRRGEDCLRLHAYIRL